MISLTYHINPIKHPWGIAFCYRVGIGVGVGNIIKGLKVVNQLLFNYQEADDKIFICKFSKNVKSKLYHTKNSKTRGQTV